MCRPSPVRLKSSICAANSPIERPRVDPDHVDALVDQPERAVAIEARLAEVLGRSPPRGRARVNEHDVAGAAACSSMARSACCRSAMEITSPGLPVAQVEHDAGTKAPLEGHLVDPPRGLAGRRGAVVVRRIDVRGGVARHGQVLDRPAVPIGVDEVLGRRAEGGHHARQAAGLVGDVLDLRLRSFAGRVVFEGHARDRSAEAGRAAGRGAMRPAPPRPSKPWPPPPRRPPSSEMPAARWSPFVWPCQCSSKSIIATRPAGRVRASARRRSGA